jgi:primase-polymerase (primpol)-like protein
LNQILIDLEGENLFLINNIQEEEKSLEDAVRQKQKAVDFWENKLNRVMTNCEIMKAKKDQTKKQEQRLDAQFEELYGKQDKRKKRKQSVKPAGFDSLEKTIIKCYKAIVSEEAFSSELNLEERLRRIEAVMHEKLEIVEQLISNAKPEELKQINTFQRRLMVR